VFEGIFLMVFLIFALTFVVIGVIVYSIVKKASRAGGVMDQAFQVAEQALTQELNKGKPVECSHCNAKVERAKMCTNCGAPLGG